MSPHYSVFCIRESEAAAHQFPSALAIGTAFSEPVPAEDVGRRPHVESVASAVRKAVANAGIERLEDVHFVQVKCPCVTVARAAAAIAAGKTPLTNDPSKSMAFARAAGAFGVALGLEEIKPDSFTDASLLDDFTIQSPRASISSGVEVESQRSRRARQQPGLGRSLAHRASADEPTRSISAPSSMCWPISALPRIRKSRQRDCRAHRLRAGEMRARSPRQHPRQSAYHARRYRHQCATSYPRRGRGAGCRRDR